MFKTIDKSNLNQAIAYVNLTTYKSAKRRLAYRISLPVCSALFFIFSLTLLYGVAELFVMGALSDKGIIDFVNKIPVIPNLWQAVFKLASSLAGVGVWCQLLVLCVAGLFVIPLIAALIIFIIVSLAYHPNTDSARLKSQEAQGDDINSIKEKIGKNAEEAARYRWNNSKFIFPCSLVFTGCIAAFAAYTAFISLYADKDIKNSDKIINSLCIILVVVIGFGLILTFYSCLMHLVLRLCEKIVAPRKDTEFIKAFEVKKKEPKYTSNVKSKSDSKETATSSSSYTSYGQTPTVFVSDVMRRMNDNNFDANGYVTSQCKDFRLGLSTDADKQRIDSDPNLSYKQKEDAKRELDRLSSLYY